MSFAEDALRQPRCFATSAAQPLPMQRIAARRRRGGLRAVFIMPRAAPLC